MIEHEGVQYARVTEVLKPFSNFDGITQEVLDRKCRIGTNTHIAIAHHLAGSSGFTVYPEERPYFASFLRWQEMTRAKPDGETERRLYCPKLRITGCIDALIRFDGGSEVVLCDWKTSSGESRIVWPMQGHLYHYLLTEAGVGLSDRLLFVKLDPDGDLPRVFQYKINAATMQKCMKAVSDFWESLDSARNRL